MHNKSRLKKLSLRTGIAFGLVALLIVAGAGVHAVIAHLKLKSVYAQLQQDSIPLSWEEYYALFPNVEAQLAAQPQFFAALDNLSNLPSLYKLEGEKRIVISPRMPELGDNATSEIHTELETYLSPLAPVLVSINEAVASEPLWRFMPKDDPGDARVPSRLIQVRDAVRQFQRTAILHAERNEPMEAAQAVVDGIRLAMVLNRGATALDATIRCLLERTALRSLEYVLAKTDPSRRSLLELKRLLSKHSGIRNAMLGEFVFVQQGWDVWAELSPSDLEEMIMIDESYTWEKLLVYLTLLPGWIRMNEAFHLEFFNRVIGSWDLPWQDFINHYEQAHNSIPRLYFLVTMYDVFISLKNRELLSAGSWNCGLIAVAVEMYSQKHGRLPESLSELVPEYLEKVPTEPFYGKSFEYETDGGSGTLSFSYPNSGDEEWKKGNTYRFRVYANRASIPPKH